MFRRLTYFMLTNFAILMVLGVVMAGLLSE